MSRTRKEIAQGMKEEFMDSSTLIELYDLDTTKSTDFDYFFSSVSLETIIINTIAFATYLHEQLWDSFQTLIQGIVDNQYVMSFSWYRQKALEFQLGYELQYNTNSNQYSYGYSAEDDDAKIIKYCAVRQETNEDNVTVLHVLYSGEDKAAITGDSKTAFEDYMKQIGAAGIHYVFTSQSPDTVILTANIYYDALILQEDGTTFDTNVDVVKNAIDEFLDNIEYGGKFRITDLEQAIKAADGVNDCVISSISLNGTAQTTAKLSATSGAFVFDSTNSTRIYTKDELD